MKRFLLLLTLLMLVGCGKQTAEQHGEGISIEIGDIEGMNYLELMTYVNGGPFGGTIDFEKINNEEYYELGDIIWFNVQVIQSNNRQEIEVLYSDHRGGRNAIATNRVDISSANKWVNARLTSEFELDVLDFE
ncbi:hypothetical protein FLK61_23500 [Paenalkalicoccus suaedae]|uniref:DUF3221 domain-containing protein n=1 Tax=Paenalkalicoccus suaedae TaxID=2592382 RepID=A0A859F9G2_9BACI|nr:hypothetical protein [Paenalkalicoccus suaedae]QKS69763.1 hypothetical protein FLK61_23500 [Paenalkalicoccus suaedae]